MHMYLYVVVLDQYTPMAGKKIYFEADVGGGGGRGHQVFSSLHGSLRGNRCFFNVRFEFQEPPSGNK